MNGPSSLTTLHALLALVGGERQWSYRELNEEANRLAHYLRGCGIGRDRRVALALPRGADLVVAVLAVLKTGGAYVPLDVSAPAGRHTVVLTTATTALLLTVTGVAAEWPVDGAPGGPRVRLDRVRAEFASGPVNNLVPPDPEAEAYVPYTSGSTGAPKGVVMTHGALANLLAWQWAEFSGRPARTLQFSSFTFDVSFQELFSTLGCGGSLHLISDEARRDPKQLLDHLERGRIERLFLPFVALEQLARTAVTAGRGLPALRDVVTAGEALQITDAIVHWFGREPQCRLHNQYGPTETHVVTQYTLTGAPETWPPLPPIGRPIDGVRVYLLDDTLKPVPVGAVGELCVGAGRGARVRGAATGNRYAFRPGPVRRSPRRADVPDGRSGPVPERRSTRIPGPARRPDQDPRLPR